MRRRRAQRREPAADPKYHNRVLGKFINVVMERGKKALAERIVYQALESAAKTVNVSDPVEVFQKALNNVRPLVEVKSRRVGGATYQVPLEIPQERGTSVAMRWLRDFAKNRKGKPMQVKLAQEFAEAYRGEGPAVKKREDTHKMAEANKAFSHYRW